MNISNLDLNLLVAFDALVSERHVSRAAARVGLTQPAMSNSLARLRVAFDDPLLVRTGRTMVPTARAQTLAGPVRQAMHLLREAVDAPSSSRLIGRTFVIGATEYADHLLLPRLVQVLLEVEPGVRIIVRRLPTLFQAPEDELQAGLLDLAVGFFPEPPSLRPGILSQRLFEEESVAVVRQGHPQVRSGLRVKRYAALGHVSIFYHNDGSSLLDRLLLARALPRTVVLQVPHLSSALSVVSQTDLITTVPRRFAFTFTRYLRLRCFAVPLPLPTLRLAVLWHSRNDTDPALQFLREQLTKVCNQVSKTPSRIRKQ